jgi:glycosyltransferase involved in cell wall biosynthesis
MGVEPARIVTGFNAVDNDLYFRPGERSQDTTPGHKFLYLGKLVSRKNVAALMRAFDAIACSDDQLIIVGDGPERPTLERLRTSLRSREQIRLREAMSSEATPELLRASHTLVLPSLTEVWGLVVNEALAAQSHVVVSSRCGVADSVADMPGAFIVEPNPDAIASGMAASRDQWSGPIATPDILDNDPSKFTQDVLRAITYARVVSRRR